MAVNREAPNSPSKVIDRVAKDNWRGSTPPGQTPAEALADKKTKQTVDVPSPPATTLPNK